MGLDVVQIAAAKWLMVEKIMHDEEFDHKESKFRTALHDQIYVWKHSQSFVGPDRIKLDEHKYLFADCDSGWNLYSVSDDKETFIRHLNEFENSFINSAIAQVVQNATHIQIPPPFHGQDNSDVAYAEGWNQACVHFFCNNQPPEPVVITIEHTPEDTIPVQEAWLLAGGNPGIKATKEDVKFILTETLHLIEDAEDKIKSDDTNPLYVFAREVAMGAYKPEELENVALRALERYRKVK